MTTSGAFRRAARRVSTAFGVVVAAAAGIGTTTVGLAVPATPASAATTCASVTSFTWSGAAAAAGSRNWSNATNWSGLSAPTSNSCVSLTFPSSAIATGTSNNDLSNLEITALSIGGPYTLTGNTVFMGDSGAAATVTDTANATIAFTQNARNNTVYNVSSGSKLTVSGTILDVTPFPATVVTSSGAGTLDLAPSTPNTYTGNTVVSAGVLQLADPSALGATGNTVTVQSGGTLEMGPVSGAFHLPQAVALAGGTVLGTDANDYLDGALSMTNGGTLSAQSAKDLNVTQAIKGTGPLMINSGTPGTVTLGGTADNTYSGGTTVGGGTLSLAVVPTSGTGIATPGALSANSGSAVTLADPGQLDPAGDLTLTGSSSLDLAGNPTAVSNLVMNSTSSTGAPTVKNTGGAASLTVSSTITSEGTGLPAVISAGLEAPASGPAAPLSIQAPNSLLLSGPLSGGPISLTAGSPNDCTSGTSTARCTAVVLSGANPTYAGPVTVGAGVLDITGDLSGAPVTVGGGTLTGTGKVGAITVNSGTLAPGTRVATPSSQNFTDADSPGVLTAPTLTMTGGTLAVRLDGASPGTGSTACSGYDQLDVTGGSVALGSSVANLSTVVDKKASGAPCYIPANNQPYTIISNAASGAAETGNFNGLPEGATVTDQNFNYGYLITYAGGTPPASVVLTSTVNTNMTLTTSASPVTYGRQVVFTATVSPTGSGSPTPGGTVAFTDNDNGQTVTLVCSESGSNANNVVPLGANVAKCTPTQALPGGANQTVTASYSGDSNYSGNSATVSQTVNPQPTTTSVSGGTPNPSTYGQAVSFKATVAGVPSTGTQAATALPTGTVTFFANGNPLPDCTSVALTTSSPTTATCSTTMLPAGSNKVTATYSGDGNYAGSTTGQSATQTVNKSTTTTTIAASNSNPNPSSYGQPLTFTATITPTSPGSATPSGTVEFDASGTALADCSAVPVTNSSNTVTCNTSDLPVGTDTVTATYSGDSNYAGSASGSTSQTVNQTTTTTGVTTSVNPAAVGQHVTYTVTVTPQYSGLSSPTGTVAFSVGSTTIPGCGAQAVATSAGKTTATCTVLYNQVGQYTIGAAYSGDGNYVPSSTTDAASPTGPVTQQVDAASTVTHLSSSPNPSQAQQAVTFVATVVPSSSGTIAPTGTVTLKVNGTTLTGCNAVPVSTTNGTTSATCTTTALPAPTNDPQVTDPVTASYSGDGNYSSSSDLLFQTVRLNASQLGAEPRVAAFQANGGTLWSVGSTGWIDWNVGMAPNTSPSMISLPNGGYEIAFQANGGVLWTVGTAGWTDWNVGMAPNTSPTVIALPKGGYEVAFQAYGGALWTVGNAGWTDWNVGMAQGTSPSMVALPAGGFELAFQANGGHLWTIGSAGWTDWNLGMAGTTSPSIALNPSGGLIEGIQAYNNDLVTVGSQDYDWQLGMAPNTSPSMV